MCVFYLIKKTGQNVNNGESGLKIYGSSYNLSVSLKLWKQFFDTIYKIDKQQRFTV